MRTLLLWHLFLNLFFRHFRGLAHLPVSLSRQEGWSSAADGKHSCEPESHSSRPSGVARARRQTTVRPSVFVQSPSSTAPTPSSKRPQLHVTCSGGGGGEGGGGGRGGYDGGGGPVGGGDGSGGAGGADGGGGGATASGTETPDCNVGVGG